MIRRFYFAICCLVACFRCVGQDLAITAVTNAADFKPGLSQNGSATSVFLTGLDSFINLSVWINFLPAPILSVSNQGSYQQINVQVPWDTGIRDARYIEVIQIAMGVPKVASFELPYTTFGFREQPGWSVFFVDQNQNALMRHVGDSSPVTPENTARAGEDLIAYGINLGPVKKTPMPGVAAANDSGSLVDFTSISPSVCSGYDRVLIGSVAVEPAYDGLAPGLVGVYQLNFRVPSLPSGRTQISVQRTTTVFPFGDCHPDRQTITSTITSAPAFITIR